MPIYQDRAFWRLEDAYNDFKYYPKADNMLTYDSYKPIKVDKGNIYIVDYTLKDGSTKREIHRADGNTWRNELATDEIIISTELMEINGKEYTTIYLGKQDLSNLLPDKKYREIRLLKDAYNDFKDYPKTNNVLTYGSYNPIKVDKGNIYIVDYTLKDGSTKREIHRADGNTWRNQLVTDEITLPKE